MKIFILTILLVLSGCNQTQVTETQNKSQEKNEVKIENKDYRESGDGCSYGNRLIVNIDKQTVNEIRNVISSKESCEHSYDRTQIEVQIKDLNYDSLTLLEETNIHRDFEGHRLLLQIETVKSSGVLYDFMKLINRNIAVFSVSINIVDQSIKINEKLFTEILQNSRFAYGVSLDFDDSFSQIEVLRRMQSSNTISLGFNNYTHGKTLDEFVYFTETTRRLNFRYKGKNAQYYIDNGEEKFEYYEGPGSESIPFEYDE